MGSHGNIMPLHIYRKKFPRATKEQLSATRNENIKLQTYNSTTITHLGRCKLRTENSNKMKICSFFVVPRKGKALLGMLLIEILGILTISCNITDMKQLDGTENCKTNTGNSQEQTREQHYINMRQEAGTIEKYCTNTDSISKFQNKDKPMVTDNDSIKYFLQGPNSDINKRVSTEIIQQLQREFKDEFNGIWCFNGTFSLQVKPDSKPYQTT